MIQHRFSVEADAAAERYGALVDAWRLIYHEALDSKHFGTEFAISQAKTKSYALAAPYIEAERERIAQTTEKIAWEALSAMQEQLCCNVALDLTEAMSEHLSALQGYLMHDLLTQIERDVSFLAQSIRRTALQVTLNARASNVPLRSALMEHRIGSSAELKFYFHDRRNAKWPARKFVRSIWRHALLTTYNEIALMTIADHGIETAIIDHPDSNAECAGLVIAMSSGSANPTYVEVRDGYFHPNSDAIIRAN